MDVKVDRRGRVILRATTDEDSKTLLRLSKIRGRVLSIFCYSRNGAGKFEHVAIESKKQKK